jgi:hypothetical protein
MQKKRTFILLSVHQFFYHLLAGEINKEEVRRRALLIHPLLHSFFYGSSMPQMKIIVITQS